MHITSWLDKAFSWWRVDLAKKDRGEPGTEVGLVRSSNDDTPCVQANVVGSAFPDAFMSNLPPQDRQHYLVVDIDHDSKLLESSTRGRHHLFVKKEMTFDQLMDVLEAMQRAGLVDKKYVDLTRTRGVAQVRAPWCVKLRSHASSTDGETCTCGHSEAEHGGGQCGIEGCGCSEFSADD